MIEIVDCAQGSPEWFAARAGIPTASRFGDILAKGQGKTRRTYLLTLLGERMTGELAESFTNPHIERGKVMEEEARNTYAYVQEVEPQLVGFIRNGDRGCSPDCLIGNDGMAQIKTKLPKLQLEVLLADEFPSEHKPQVQGEIWTAEREWSDFVSYWPGLPIFIKRVHRDDRYIAELDKAVRIFLDELNELHEQLKRRYAA